MAAEARIIVSTPKRPGDPRVTCLCLGPGPDAAKLASSTLCKDGVSGLVSFGIAGGLKPGLLSGTVIIARSVVSNTGDSIETDATWRRRLLKRYIGNDSFVEGTLYGSDVPLLTRHEKSAVFKNHGALAVDTESHRIAAEAQAAGLPFIAIRAIADVGGQSVPSYAISGLKDDGTTQIGPVLAGLARSPWSMPALIRAGYGTHLALRGLRGILATAGVGLGITNFVHES